MCLSGEGGVGPSEKAGGCFQFATFKSESGLITNRTTAKSHMSGKGTTSVEAGWGGRGVQGRKIRRGVGHGIPGSSTRGKSVM